MVATYYREGRGKSLNAIRAEENGILPATHAAKKLGVSLKVLRGALTPCEWHHVGKYATPCDYYDTDMEWEDALEIIKQLKAQKQTKKTIANIAKFRELARQNYAKCHNWEFVVTPKDRSKKKTRWARVWDIKDRANEILLKYEKLSGVDRNNLKNQIFDDNNLPKVLDRRYESEVLSKIDELGAQLSRSKLELGLFFEEWSVKHQEFRERFTRIGLDYEVIESLPQKTKNKIVNKAVSVFFSYWQTKERFVSRFKSVKNDVESYVIAEFEEKIRELALEAQIENARS